MYKTHFTGQNELEDDKGDEEETCSADSRETCGDLTTDMECDFYDLHSTGRLGSPAMEAIRDLSTK